MNSVAISPLRRTAGPCCYRLGLGLPVLSLCWLLAGTGAARAQQPPPPAAQAQPVAPLPTTENLKLLILAGQREANDLQRRVMAPLVVQVLDQSDNPVEGAEVVFRFPSTGPSAMFDGQKASATVRSNAEGQARATNWMANNQTGAFQVRVTASLGNEFGQTIVTMSNVSHVTAETGRAHHRYWNKKVAIVVAVVAAGAVTGILLSRNSGGGGTTKVTISPGTPTLGGAH